MSRSARLFFRLTLIVAIAGAVRVHGEDHRVYAERIFLSRPGGDSVAIAYRVYENALVRLKENASFLSKFTLGVEMLDSKQKILGREILEKEFRFPVGGKEDPERNVQGFVVQPLNKNVRTISLTFTDVLAERELRRVQFHVSSGDSFPSWMSPVSAIVNRDGAPVITLMNRDGVIPFSVLPAGVLLSVPVPGFKPKWIELKGADTLYRLPVKKVFNGAIEAEGDKNALSLRIQESSGSESIIYADSISLKLYPGAYNVSLSADTGKEYKIPWLLNVNWFNRPEALNEIATALKLLQVIDEKSDTLTELRKERQSKALWDYWKKYDPDTSNAYNEVMTEFYTRCDFAAGKFATLKLTDGVETDRGKTYIRFGKPLRQERSATIGGKISELWEYPNGRRFYFVDNSGTGKFELVESP